MDRLIGLLSLVLGFRCGRGSLCIGIDNGGCLGEEGRRLLEEKDRAFQTLFSLVSSSSFLFFCCAFLWLCCCCCAALFWFTGIYVDTIQDYRPLLISDQFGDCMSSVQFQDTFQLLLVL